MFNINNDNKTKILNFYYFLKYKKLKNYIELIFYYLIQLKYTFIDA